MSSGWTNTFRFVSTSSTICMQKCFLGYFPTSSHLLQWHPGASEILEFVSLMHICQCNTNNTNRLTQACCQNPSGATSVESLKEKTANHLPYFSVRHFGTMVMNAQRGSNITLLSDEKSKFFKERKIKSSILLKHLQSARTSFHYTEYEAHLPLFLVLFARLTSLLKRTPNSCQDSSERAGYQGQWPQEKQHWMKTIAPVLQRSLQRVKHNLTTVRQGRI